ncbi:MAG: ATP-binding protein [Microlunatus sp.]|nr:ATP-binding protein [Microlunatus sp.]
MLADGSIDLFRRVGREDVQVGAMDAPGRWSGGFVAWDDHGVCLATGVGSAAGRLLQVPASELRVLLQRWFPFGVHLLAGMSGTARAIESTARERQSLVRLGTLAAGLAHELNNPAAAAIRNVAALKASIDAVFSSLAALSAAQISADQFASLDEVRDSAVIHAASGTASDPLAVADLEDEITTWMSARHCDSPWETAASLAAAGVGLDLCERVESAVPAAALAPALTWIAQSAAVATLLEQLTDSTKRISALVAATRSYTQMDRGSSQTIDVTEGLESTLTMLTRKLAGVTVVREFASDRPRIDAYPGELNQVWTNLIDNAVDAMSGSGTLRLTVRPADTGGVLVEIADSGTGMTPEVAARAFEAFYTTKDVGSGTGLGLDIAHRIVAERHGGAIEIDSQPGQTVMRVRLPASATPR